MAGTADRAPFRLFIAALLPEELAGTLLAAQRLLAGNARRISLTREDQLHLTLRFIGETGPGDRDRIMAWFSRLPVLSPEGRRMTQAAYGAFPGREGLTLWAGLNCAPEVFGRVAVMETALRALGCSPETKAWLPHVTLARRAELGTPFGPLAPKLPRVAEPMQLGVFVLFRSEFTPGGMRYTPLMKIG